MLSAALAVAALMAFAPPVAAAIPGSSFQGGDGNQDDEAPLVDWQGLQASGRVLHNADPNQADSVFAGGSTEDEPGGWGLTTSSVGASPGNSNILDGWSSIDQTGSNTFLYLALTRAATNGTGTFAIELNQDRRMWDNGRATIPCRRTGDALVVLQVQSKGTDVFLRRWVTSAADPGTGCATRGTLEQATSPPSGTTEGAANDGPIESHLPGFFPPSSTIPDARQFAEGAIDLGRLLDSAFGEPCFAFNSIWLHSLASTSPSSQVKDYVAPQHTALRTCAASGTKFLDANANGTRDPGEPGMPRFLIWADYNGDGIVQSTEPSTVSDTNGHYVLENIRPPSGSYKLREALLARRRVAATDWVCSFPHAGTPGGFGDGTGGLFPCGWGPIDATATPDAQGLDFGNWLPAQLTLEKQLWPPSDPGRFDLLVNGQAVLAGAGDEATKTLTLAPGTYDVSEQAVPPANAADYHSSVVCSNERTSASVTLTVGAQAGCTFYNVLRGAAAIAIRKSGPRVAEAGATLHYTLHVSNPGDVPLPSSAVKVTDPRCDHQPVLTGKSDGSGSDDSPSRLDPGDTWTYACSHKTSAPESCKQSAVSNIATVTATAAGTTLIDHDSLVTVLTCPDKPPLEPEVPSTPGGSGSESQPPDPPPAGAVGAAGLVIRKGCLGRLSQVRVVGTSIRNVRISVDGHAAGHRSAAILQRTVRLPARRLGPGRHRISVRITFRPGAGGAPVTLTRSVRSCAALQRPRFVG